MAGTPNPVSTRYAYLVGRLRNRQITMEEATELFGIMDETIRMLRTTTIRVPPPPAPTRPPAAAPSAVTAPATSGTPTIGADDLLTAGVLMIGAGVGISAALRRRVADEQRSAGSQAASADAPTR